METVRESGADVVGIDWRLPLSRARAILGEQVAVQGNLDPTALFAPRDALGRQVDRVLEEAGPAPGHIFNLGHGIERTTDPDAVAFWSTGSTRRLGGRAEASDLSGRPNGGTFSGNSRFFLRGIPSPPRGAENGP